MGQTIATSLLEVLGAPSDLPELEKITRFSPKVIRVTGQNPGQATLQGTNTYIVGTGAKRVLIDTSDGNKNWWPLVQKVLSEEHASVSEVLLTHQHYDHVGGISEVLEAFPEARLWKATGQDIPEQKAGVEFMQQRCPCEEGYHFGQIPGETMLLRDNEVITVEGASLRAVVTPGHTPDSCCFVLGEESTGAESFALDPKDVIAIFTGDTVLGGRTAIFSNLTQYGISLRRLQRWIQLGSGCTAIYPGHGEFVPPSRASSYINSIINMQDNRENAIIEALQVQPDQSATVGDICAMLYAGTIAGMMAEQLILQHLEDMTKKGVLRETTGLFGRRWWELAESY